MRDPNTPRGVHWCKRERKWVAQCSINGKKRHLGYFGSVEAAALARRRAEGPATTGEDGYLTGAF